MVHPIALITGASRGLGKQAALALAARGVDLIITYRSQADEAAAVVAEATTLGVRAHALPLDVADSSSFAAFARQVQEQLGAWQRQQIDFLVNNAGIGIHATLEQTTEQQFDTLFNIHLKGVFFLTQQLLPLIRDGGRILNLSSGLTRFALPGYAAYAAMKGGVEVLTRYLAKELGPRGIAVNVVAPGAIETDFGGGVVRDNQAVNDFIASQTALGRVGKPEDIGGVIAALLSSDSRWINAQRIEASGGMFL
ncbi:SDR family NAD(P)-dependent oxidoreductase [Aeromonas hydrophila]|uniref:SDR family NAD(P)-dependent oxidoreductase n=1 Tax=Aeromonas hydrophila TaxID=644 RepID=UPI00236568E0|nr:SDR family oxidoreductase [Aeromonas hydrophila]WDF91845.1 SDR family oxidoreductase [Aeromonas hydrophila subsp. hydrophila]